MTDRKIGILAVSFGTSHDDTREKTIDALENDFRNACPGVPVYRSWTSKMIIRKVNKRDNIHIFTVTEGMEQMAKDGITHVIVQPTHILNGVENDIMKEEVLAFKDQFESIAFGTPLLSTEEDKDKVIEIMAKVFGDLKTDQALVFMGHGSEHYANSIYAAFDYALKEKGYDNIFMGTVEAYPAVEQVINQVKAYNPNEVILTPFMIVAGDHAKNDMAGDDEDSWLSLFKAEGYDVKCVIKGLGEYAEIRELFVEHLKEAYTRL